MHRGRGDTPDRMVALVDLLPGLRVLSNLIDDNLDGLSIDEPLELAWLPLDDGRALPQFRRTNSPAVSS